MVSRQLQQREAAYLIVSRQLQQREAAYLMVSRQLPPFVAGVVLYPFVLYLSMDLLTP
jgi:hypothetical protein